MVGAPLPLTFVENQDTASQVIATFQDPSMPGASASAYTAQIDWGDGTATAGTIAGPVGGVYTVSGHHAYAEESSADHPASNPYSISATVTRLNLLANGGFELPAIAPGTFKHLPTIPGWSQSSGSSIELQRSYWGAPFEGEQLLGLASPAPFSLNTGVAGSPIYSIGYVAVPTSGSQGVQNDAQLADYVAGTPPYSAHPLLANPAFDATQAAAVTITSPNSLWAVNNSTSAWIGANSNGSSTGTSFASLLGSDDPTSTAPQGYYYYTTTFSIGSPPPYSLNGSVWTSDNQGVGIFLNSHNEGQTNPGSFASVSTAFTLNAADFVSGVNTLTFVVFNEQYGGVHGSPTGIRIQGSLAPADVSEPSGVGLSAIQQAVATGPGQQYLLSFAYSPRPGVQDNPLNVTWDGQIVAKLNVSGVGLSDTNWQTYTFQVPADAQNPSSLLSFDDQGTVDPFTSLGTYIDNVQLVPLATTGGTGISAVLPPYGAARSTSPVAMGTAAAIVSDPSVVATPVNFAAIEGVPQTAQPVATFTDPGGAEALSDYTAQIQWGDDSSSPGMISGPDSHGVFTVTGSHTYAQLSGAVPNAVQVTIGHETASPVTVVGTASVGPIVVNTQGDAAADPDGVVSLRDAVALANHYSSFHHDITFDPALSGKTIALNSVLTVSSSMTISGLGAAATTITAVGATPARSSRSPAAGRSP